MSEVNHEAFSRSFPKESIKQRRGNGGVMLNYVETHTVIRRLIEATGNNFNFRVLSIDQTSDLVTATVELEIPSLGKRQHCGTARVVGGNNEDTIKCAISDSLKKVASLFMPSLLALYGPDYEAERPQASPTTRPVQAPRQYAGGNGNNGNGHREPVGATNGRRVGFRPIQQDN
jgi:hypothetical protein